MNIDFWVPAHHLIDQLVLNIQALPDLSLLIFEFVDVPLNKDQSFSELLLSALQVLILSIGISHLPGDFQAIRIFRLGT
jgi:hypothetical protein